MSTSCAAAISWVLWAVLLACMLADDTHADCCRAGETQACADAAAERIQTLETTLEEQAAVAEAAAAEARKALATLQEQAAAGLQKAEADMATALEAAAADKKAAVGALQAQLQQVQVGKRLMHLPAWLPAHVFACQTGRRRFLKLLSRTQHPMVPAFLLLSLQLP